MTGENFAFLLKLVEQEIEVVEELRAAGNDLIRSLRENDPKKVNLAARQQEFLAARLAELEENRQELQQSLKKIPEEVFGPGEEAVTPASGEQDRQLGALYERLAGAVAGLRKVNETGRALLIRAFWVHRQLVRAFVPEEGEKYDPQGFLQVERKRAGVFDRQV